MKISLRFELNVICDFRTSDNSSITIVVLIQLHKINFNTSWFIEHNYFSIILQLFQLSHALHLETLPKELLSLLAYHMVLKL